MAGLGTVHLLLLAVILAVLGGLVLALLALRRQDALSARTEAVLAGHRPAQTDVPSELAAWRERLLASAAMLRLCALLDLRPAQLHEYRPRWFLVLAGAALGGWLAGRVAADVLTPHLAWPATLLGFVLLSRAVFGALHRARSDALYRQFPDALAQITRAVRAGLPVIEAIRSVAEEAPQPTATEFAAIVDRMTLGVALDEALADTAMRTGLAEYRFFATALVLQARTGGSLAETLDNLAEVIRRRVALRQRAHALASEAKTSAAILTSLPFLTGAALFVVTPSYAMVLFTTESGKLALGLAAGLLTFGILMMRSIIRRSLS